MTEWPLILFTVALQMACGLTLSATLHARTAGGAQDVTMRRLGVAIFPLIALGLLASLFHLGRPLAAPRALSNLGSSRLSLEIFLSLLFALAAFGYGLSWWKRITRRRFWAGVVTSLAGIAAVASSFAIYTFPTQPAWDSGWLPISFLGTVLLFAGIVPAALVITNHARLLKTYLILGLAGGLAHLVSTMWMFAKLARSVPDDFAAARLQGALHLLLSDYVVWLALTIFLTIVLPVAFVLKVWPGKNGSGVTLADTTTAWSLKAIVLTAIVAGVIIGRALMYAIGTFIPHL